jgi:hypothetical protein
MSPVARESAKPFDLVDDIGSHAKGPMSYPLEAPEIEQPARKAHASPIVRTLARHLGNAPEVAVLGVSKAQIKPVWDGDVFVPKLMLPLSLSYDHRVIDGAAAARFTTFVGSVLADFRRVLV